MRRKLGIFCMFSGAVLVLMALSLFLYNTWDSNRAGDASALIIEELEQSSDEQKIRTTGEMTVVNIDGYDYIGYLKIPSLDLKLPVMAAWSYEGLRIAPGRFSGATFTGDLVICGHNYSRHFGEIRWLEQGANVQFLDMDGVTWKYKVDTIETLEPTQVEDMTTKTANDTWDMTLFTCNTGGQTRCAVRCTQVGQSVKKHK